MLPSHEIFSPKRLLIRLKPQHATLYHVDELAHPLTQGERVHLNVHLPRFLSEHGAEIRTFGTDPPHHQKLLKQLDLQSYDKFFYDLDLGQWEAPELTRYQGVSLKSLGKTQFIDAMVRASIGDPLSEDIDPQAEFQELKTQAERAFDEANWYVIRFDEEPIGVVLPQVFPDKASEGTLFYVGVFPEARKQGHGKNIHSWGLNELKRRGCTRYVGSTGNDNQGMQHIFQGQNCRLKHHLTFFKP